MTRIEMMDSIIRARGLEDGITIWFCGKCEDATCSDEQIEKYYTDAIITPIWED